jgi:transcriptional regulator with XRE-family HTH domain
MLARRGAGLTQTHLADKSGLTQVSISQIENGRADAGISTLHRIATALDLKLSQLLEGID